MNEVRDHVLIFRIGSTNDPGVPAQGFAVHETPAIQQNCVLVVEAIDAVTSTQTTDRLQCSPIAVSQQVHTGKPGHPAIKVETITLQQLPEPRGPGGTGELLGCGSKTA